jgi:hypothetical protein
LSITSYFQGNPREVDIIRSRHQSRKLRTIWKTRRHGTVLRSRPLKLQHARRRHGFTQRKQYAQNAIETIASRAVSVNLGDPSARPTPIAMTPALQDWGSPDEVCLARSVVHRTGIADFSHLARVHFHLLVSM